MSRALVVTAISAGVAGAALLYEGSTAKSEGIGGAPALNQAETTFGAVLLGVSLVALAVVAARKAPA